MTYEKSIFCGADFGSTIALERFRDLQQKLEAFLHSSQKHMPMRIFLGIYSSFVYFEVLFVLNFHDFYRFL